ncbi:MAG: stage II sporulation protein D [Anaerovorax sp.]
MRKNHLLIMKCFVCIFSFMFVFLILFPMAALTFSAKEDHAAEKPKTAASSETKPLVVSPLLVDTILVFRHETGQTQLIDFETYVKGVVASEMPHHFEMEALKAQAVSARTYSLSKIIRSGNGGNPNHPSAPICDTTHCQVYRSKEDLKKLKGQKWIDSGWPRIEKAVDDTKDQVMYYDGNLVEQALFHSSSGGKTENSEDVFVATVPYLRSVDSPYETGSPHEKDITSIKLADISERININSVNPSTVKVQSRSDGGHVEAVQIGDVTMSGRDARTIFSLPSTDFTVQLEGDTLLFTSSGYGHGVGLSQWGANGMAKKGYHYKQILSHYYSGITIIPDF